jgi:signal transduction histidine kinase
MRFRIPLWAEIAIAILAALAISNLATILFYQVEVEGRWQKFGDELLADRIGDTAAAILSAPEARRAELIRAFTKRHEHYTLDDAPFVTDKAPRDAPAEKRIATHLTGDSKKDIRVVSLPGHAFFTRRTDGLGWGFFEFGAERGGHVFHDGNVTYRVGPGEPGTAGRPETRVLAGTPASGAPPAVDQGPVIAVQTGPGVAQAPSPPPPGDGHVFGLQIGPHPGGPPPPPERMIVSIPAGTGKWLNARVGLAELPAMPWVPIFSAGVAVATLMLAAVWTARRVAVPLQRLSLAARAMRRGEPAPVVPETGPAAVRDATRSFNAMSQRLMATLESQRAMMVAIAHDLRTPIATMRLRAEFVEDTDAKAKLLETLGEMQGMTEAVLDAARTGQTTEPARAVDLSALAESLAADMSEIGGDVSFISGSTVQCVCRTSEIRRALRNLIENAVRYGKRARVAVNVSGEEARITVDDDGPGIPEVELERVFEPFARLEESRSKETGGYGLGLSIVRLIARSHGGEVKLENRPEGGLRATLSLPLNS